MTGKRGFTLIELLVVLAVVGTLLALAAPHYLGSVDKAKEVVLRENLSTMRATLDKFYADTGKYPDSLEELVSMRYLRVILWLEKFWLLKSTKTFICNFSEI